MVRQGACMVPGFKSSPAGDTKNSGGWADSAEPEKSSTTTDEICFAGFIRSPFPPLVQLFDPNGRAFFDGWQLAGELTAAKGSRHLLQLAEEG